jgi:hypothetical protein
MDMAGQGLAGAAVSDGLDISIPPVGAFMGAPIVNRQEP